MKNSFHNILGIFLFTMLLAGCSATKNTWYSRNMQALSTEYNVLFNAKTSYEEGLNIINKAHTDDYSALLPLYPISVHTNAAAATPQMERAIEKVQKAVKIHSIKKKPNKKAEKAKDPKYQAFLKQEEYNYRIDEGWILLGKAQFHKADFLAAVGTFTYTINHFSWDKECVSEAKIWLAKSYIEMDWLYDAEDILTKANKDQVPSKLSGIYSATSSDLLLKNKKYKETIPLLTIAASEEKDKTQRTRFYYILGQLYRMEKNDTQAKYYFSKVIKANPPSDMEFNARISRAEAETENPDEAIKFLRKMLKNTKYTDYQDKIYFTIGNIYKKQEDYVEAFKNYKLAIDKSGNNIVNKVQILIALADLYYSQSNYLEAQPYYKEASSIMPLENPEYERINTRSQLLDKLNQQYEIVSLQDSLQELTKLTNDEKKVAIEALIKKLQEEETALKEKLLAETAAENNSFLSGEADGLGMDRSYGVKVTGDWYFYNNMLISSGRGDFQRKWGVRKLEDNWRRKNKAALGNDDALSQGTESANLTSNDVIAAEDNFSDKSLINTDINYYLKQIPSDDADIATSNKQIGDALYTIGMIYKEDIEDLDKARLTFEDLERRFPKDERLADIYYNLYQMSMKANDSISANNYRNQIIQKFPKSSYAVMFSMPDYAERIAQLKFKEDSIYQATYFAYLKGEFQTVFDNYKLVQEKYPLTELMPKFMFLNALSHGKSKETDLFKEGMQHLISEYPQSDVSPMAKDILALTIQGYEVQAGGSHGSMINRRDSLCLCQTQTVDSLSFETNLKDKHFIIFVAPKEASLNKLQYDVAIYNFTGFMIKEFDIDIKKSINSNLLIISTLDGFEESLWYKEGLLKDREVDNFVKLNGCRSIIISETNFELIKKGHSIEEYLDYYNTNIAPIQGPKLSIQPPTIAPPKAAQQVPILAPLNAAIVVSSVATKLDSSTVQPTKTVNNTIVPKTGIAKKDTIKSMPSTPKLATTSKTETKAIESTQQKTNTPTKVEPLREGPKTATAEPKNTVSAEATSTKKPETPTKVEPLKEIVKTITKPESKPTTVSNKNTVNTKPITPTKVEPPKIELVVATKPKETENKTPATYTYNAMETHSYGIMVLEGSFDFNKLKAGLDVYNSSNTPLANYKVIIQDVGGQKIVLVGGFPTASAAKTYLFKIIRSRELFDALKNTAYRNVIISKTNLDKLIKAANCTDYLEFNRNSNMQ